MEKNSQEETVKKVAALYGIPVHVLSNVVEIDEVLYRINGIDLAQGKDKSVIYNGNHNG